MAWANERAMDVAIGLIVLTGSVVYTPKLGVYEARA